MKVFYLKLHTHILEEKWALMLLKQLMLHRKIYNFRNHLPMGLIFFVTSFCFLNYFVSICVRAGLYFRESKGIQSMFTRLHNCWNYTEQKNTHVVLRRLHAARLSITRISDMCVLNIVIAGASLFSICRYLPFISWMGSYLPLLGGVAKRKEVGRGVSVHRVWRCLSLSDPYLLP